MSTTSSELGKVLRQQEVGLRSGKVTIFRDFFVNFSSLEARFGWFLKGMRIFRWTEKMFPIDRFLNFQKFWKDNQWKFLENETRRFSVYKHKSYAAKRNFCTLMERLNKDLC